MDLIQAMKERHSVRSFHKKPIDDALVTKLKELIDDCNRESGLNIQLITDEPKAFGQSAMAHYGKFNNADNYIALIGKKSDDLSEKAGYYGEKIVLFAQTLGLNTCWVALTFKKMPEFMAINENEKLVCVIAIGYGTTQGPEHKIKKPQKVTDTPLEQTPTWYQRGIAAALLAPTAMNQQQFAFKFIPEKTVVARAKIGFYSKVDLGIVKYHFEIGAGKENFNWKK